MDIQRVVEALNHALAQEIAALVQSFWHSVLAAGTVSGPLREKWREISIQHMRHAEALAERIDHFSAIPTTKPTEIRVGKTIQEMVQNDLELQSELVKSYRSYLDICRDDPITYDLLIELLRDEEAALDEFRAWLGQ